MISTDDLPEMAALMVLKKIATVVILIPLPVDPGDDPISPTTMMNNNVAIRISSKLVVVNPQLLNEIT